MVATVVILILLTVAASLASWLFGQWLARRIRVSSTALAIGGSGAVLLIGTVAYAAPASAPARGGWRTADRADLYHSRRRGHTAADTLCRLSRDRSTLVAALRDDACYLQVLRWSSGEKQLTTFSTGNQP
jgi:hypothetical protein